MRLEGYVNLRDNFEKMLHEMMNMDVFVSEALYAKCIAHKRYEVSDRRVYDLLFMMRFSATPKRGEPAPFGVQLGRPNMTLMAYIHPRVMALCVALPDEERLWSLTTQTPE